MLDVADLHTYYDDSHVLQGVSLRAERGKVTAVLGRNGVGKTTLCRSLTGLTPPRSGRVSCDGVDTTHLPPHRIRNAGISLVPQGRRIFTSLSVMENLAIAARGSSSNGGWTVDRVFQIFPRLAERRDHGGGELSGGEQQMLAIARILRTGARFLMLDEPTEGLAPVIIQQIGHTIRSLKEQGFTILLVEQNFRFASTVADRYYVMEHGRIVEQFANSELDANLEKLHDYLGV